MRPWVESFQEDGIRVTETTLGGTCVVELVFPPGYAQARLDPEHGYLAIVLEGNLQKTFASGTLVLERGTATAIPADAAHTASFGGRGARILVVKPPSAGGRYRELLGGIRTQRDPGLAALGQRIATELAAPDVAAPVAVEGLALELVAAAIRATPERLASARPAWLAGVVERLHDPAAEVVSLAELAASASGDPAHLGRVFRRHYGVSIGIYVRRLRLDWAAVTLAGTDAPLARIAVEQGFADQSHFTRAFKRHTGVTLARYRRLARRA
ncbi:MAG: helix-turn-helix transcriptional regulator [Actinobacteria bacterium]|nr:helix-turn-helix transcriptional regulator [Actinomycetota bacterium]